MLPYEAGDGPANMALDEALLEAVAGGAGSAYLAHLWLDDPDPEPGLFPASGRGPGRSALSNRSPMVRRLTGGGAIWHHHEVTYALVVPASHPLARPSTGFIVRCTQRSRNPGWLWGFPRPGGEMPPVSTIVDEKRPLLCFTDHDPEDIVTNGVKIVGSAQRRRGVRFSSTVPSCWRDRVARPSFLVSATWRTNRRGSRLVGAVARANPGRSGTATRGRRASGRGASAGRGTGADALPEPRVDRPALGSVGMRSSRPLNHPKIEIAVWCIPARKGPDDFGIRGRTGTARWS